MSDLEAELRGVRAAAEARDEEARAVGDARRRRRRSPRELRADSRDRPPSSFTIVPLASLPARPWSPPRADGHCARARRRRRGGAADRALSPKAQLEFSRSMPASSARDANARRS